jgi:3-oxoadipate CoA-transferase, alpha subunit
MMEPIRAADAVREIADGSTVLISGFGTAGLPVNLIDALVDHGAHDLTIVSNNAGNGDSGIAALLAAGQVRKVVCSFPRQADSHVFDSMYRSGEVELELVPQGNLAERIRAAGAGIPAFYTPTGYGTRLAAGKECRIFGDRGFVLEYALGGDVALVAAKCADRFGNLVYNKTARNFAPIMAAAGRLTLVEVGTILEVGALDPEIVVTPGIYVDRVVLARPRHSSAGEGDQA